MKTQLINFLLNVDRNKPWRYVHVCPLIIQRNFLCRVVVLSSTKMLIFLIQNNCHIQILDKKYQHFVEDSSLPSPYISAGYSGFFKNLEKWERIENGLNKRFCYQDRRTERKVLPPPPPAPKSHVLIKRQKYTKIYQGYYISDSDLPCFTSSWKCKQNPMEKS